MVNSVTEQAFDDQGPWIVATSLAGRGPPAARRAEISLGSMSCRRARRAFHHYSIRRAFRRGRGSPPRVDRRGVVHVVRKRRTGRAADGGRTAMRSTGGHTLVDDVVAEHVAQTGARGRHASGVPVKRPTPQSLRRRSSPLPELRPTSCSALDIARRHRRRQDFRVAEKLSEQDVGKRAGSGWRGRMDGRPDSKSCARSSSESNTQLTMRKSARSHSAGWRRGGQARRAEVALGLASAKRRRPAPRSPRRAGIASPCRNRARTDHLVCRRAGAPQCCSRAAQRRRGRVGATHGRPPPRRHEIRMREASSSRPWWPKGCRTQAVAARPARRRPPVPPSRPLSCDRRGG